MSGKEQLRLQLKWGKAGDLLSSVVKYANCGLSNGIIYFFIIKPSRCTNFTNLFCHETLHVSDSLSVYHQEFIHCKLSNGICHTGL